MKEASTESWQVPQSIQKKRNTVFKGRKEQGRIPQRCKCASIRLQKTGKRNGFFLQIIEVICISRSSCHLSIHSVDIYCIPLQRSSSVMREASPLDAVSSSVILAMSTQK